MPSLKINNLDEFKKVWEKAPDMRIVLQKSFPEYYKQYQQGLLDVLYPKETKQTPKVEAKPSPTKTTKAPNVGTKVFTGVGKVLKPVVKGVIPGVSVANAIANWNAPGSNWGSRTADTVSAISSFFPGVGTAVSLGTATLGEANRAINKKGAYDDTEYNKWVEQGGNFSPEYFNQDTLDRYTQHILNQNPSLEIKAQGEEINKLNPDEYWGLAEQRLNSLDPTQAIQNIRSIPEPNNQILNPKQIGSSLTPSNSDLGITSQSNIQPTLNPIIDTSNQILGQIPLVVNNTPTLTGNEIRVANNLGLDNLQNILQGNNQMQNTPIPQQNNLNEYAQYIGQLQNQNRQMQESLLNSYLNAIQEENKQQGWLNTIERIGNDLATASPVITAGFIGPNGNYIEPNYVGENPNERFRRDIPQLDRTQSKQLELQMDLASKQTQQQQEILEQIQNLESAQALGNQLGVDPAIFMNTDYGQAYLQQIINPRVVGQERRLDVYPETYADILKQRDTLAGNIDLANINNQADLQRALINAQAMRDQAYIAGNMGLQRQLFSDQNANYRARLNAENEAYLKMLGYNNAKEVARIYANQGINLQQLKNQQDNSIEKAKVFANILGNSRTPQEALQYYNMLMGNTPMVQAPTTGQGSTLTPQQYQTLLNLQRQ